MTSKPLVVFVFPHEGAPTSTRYGGFALRLQKAGGLKDVEVLNVALENLAFIVEESGEADVIDTTSGRSLSDANLVYMKSRWALPEEASALANYLFHKGIPFMDTSALGTAISKIATITKLWGNGVSVPFTLYVRNPERMAKLLAAHKTQLGEKFVLKDAKGAKGKTNFLVTQAEAKAILKQHPDVQFVAQRCIPNDGDYRIGVYATKSRFVIKRVGSGDTHLNNTSAGGTATYLKTKEIPKAYLRLAEKAADAVDLQIAGVDVIVDKNTNRPYILEVNQGSQIVTGAFTKQNMKAFSKALEDAVKHRYTRARRKPTSIIGRRAMAKVPKLGIAKAVAKIDTGAYVSTLHAENIRLENGPDGKQELVFDIIPTDQLQTKTGEPTTVRMQKFFVSRVRRSTGKVEVRYGFSTKIALHGKVFTATLSLSDRSEMKFPILIGRRLLRSRFMVNVELNENYQAEWKY